MELTWLLQSHVIVHEVLDRYREILRTRGHRVEVLRFVPFSHELIGELPEVSGPIVCYGGQGLQRLALEKGYSPGVWTSEKFCYSHYVSAFGEAMLNFEASVMLGSEVFGVISTADLDQRYFLRLDADNKAFTAQVLTGAEFVEWYQKWFSVDRSIADERLVFGRPQVLAREWRLVFVNGRFVTGSLYRNCGRLQKRGVVPAQVVSFAVEAIRNEILSEAFVLDVCEVVGEVENTLKIVEFNSLNSSGFYDCDFGLIAAAIEELVLSQN